MDSYELSQWMAYEKVSGPLGRRYGDEMLATLNEQVQRLTQVCAMLYYAWTEENPKTQVSHIPRPHEMYADKDEVETEQADPRKPGPEYVGVEALVAEAQRTGRMKK